MLIKNVYFLFIIYYFCCIPLKGAPFPKKSCGLVYETCKTTADCCKNQGPLVCVNISNVKTCRYATYVPRPAVSLIGNAQAVPLNPGCGLLNQFCNSTKAPFACCSGFVCIPGNKCAYSQSPGFFGGYGGYNGVGGNPNHG